ncbi:MAG: NAD(P)/FAD-dependent oxidoreductase [Candidatus Lokiarchaeota archaeon]|nr:NAD(P)/FAD-dependent oxidoreductase [Candidatus Lokiarchaeota archaeon]
MINHNEKDIYDFIVAGAGPAGLSAGIIAARKGHSVIILERGNIAGPKPRGEGMGYFAVVDEILGDKFLPSIGIKSNGGRVWHSPDDEHSLTTFKDYPHYFFEWREFIDRFVEVANQEGVQMKLNCEVINPIEKDGICIGVKYKTNGDIIEIRGKVVLDCSGYDGIIGQQYGIPYELMRCPIVKCLISHANYTLESTPDLNFYFIGNGDLEYSPQFPPSVIYFFPLDGDRAEVGLMLRMSQVPNMKTVKTPDNTEILRVWNEIKLSYPGFNEYFKGANIDYEEVTYLPNAKMAEKFVPHPGVVIIGDSAGFINPFGSSGLYYSMKMAKIWVNILSEKLETVDLWSTQNIDDYQARFEESEVYQEVKSSYNLIGAFEYKIFNRLRTSEKINKKWDYISNLLEQA